MFDSPARILVADDDDSARATIKALLFKQNHELHFARNGPEALDMMSEITPDVILLDVMMPEMDGYEVCRQLRAHKQWRHIPVIMVTALDGRDEMVRGLDAGADDFLTKPVSGPELQARVRSMLRIKRQYDELLALLNLREDLSKMLVHDMRSPLATILLYSQLLQHKIAATEHARYLEPIKIETQRLESFINDLLILAKLEAGRLILNRSETDANELLQLALRRHRPIAESRGLKTEIETAPQPLPISVDSNLFERLLDNLLSNAIKFTPEGRQITLRVTAAGDGNRIMFQVIDEGPGIPYERRDLIFNKFEVINQKDRRHIGLGLTFCKMIAEAHGGRISVEDNPPQGSIFSVVV
jgi:two-component system, sensor histidine kinase and response regulator